MFALNDLDFCLWLHPGLPGSRRSLSSRHADRVTRRFLNKSGGFVVVKRFNGECFAGIPENLAGSRADCLGFEPRGNPVDGEGSDSKAEAGLPELPGALPGDPDSEQAIGDSVRCHGVTQSLFPHHQPLISQSAENAGKPEVRVGDSENR